MPADTLDDLMQDVSQMVESRMYDIGPEIVTDLQGLINIPVEYRGNTVIRSYPGEPPRRELGDLWESIDFVVDRDLDQVTLVVFSTEPKSRELEWGHGKVKPRPHFTPIFNAWSQLIVPVMAELPGVQQV